MTKYPLREEDNYFYEDDYHDLHGVGHDRGVHGCDGCCADESFKKNYEQT